MPEKAHFIQNSYLDADLSYKFIKFAPKMSETPCRGRIPRLNNNTEP